MNTLEFIEKEIADIRDFLELDDVLCLQTEIYYKFWYDRLKMFQKIKTELDVLQILTKCIRVSTINYDDSDVSKTSYDYSLETDELTIEEFNTLDNYYKALEIEDEKEDQRFNYW